MHSAEGDWINDEGKGSSLGIERSEDILNLVEKFRPDFINSMTPRHQYILDSLLAEMVAENDR